MVLTAFRVQNDGRRRGNGPVNRNSICLLLRHNNIAAPHSIYKDIFKHF